MFEAVRLLATRGYPEWKGSSGAIGHPAKSRTFLVTSVSRSICAVAAMSMSACVRTPPRAARWPRSWPAAAI